MESSSIYKQIDQDGKTLFKPSGGDVVLVCPECISFLALRLDDGHAFGSPVTGNQARTFAGGSLLHPNVAWAMPYIEQRVRYNRLLQDKGFLRSRKQDKNYSAADIDRLGLAAEIAVCMYFCPTRWQTVGQTSNRGCDLPGESTGLPKPIEIKQTKSTNRYLIVRPSVNARGVMRVEDIDDSIYVLLSGGPNQFEVAGWTDREMLIEKGSLNPIPIRPGQMDCWGIKKTLLRPFAELLRSQVGSDALIHPTTAKMPGECFRCGRWYKFGASVFRSQVDGTCWHPGCPWPGSGGYSVPETQFPGVTFVCNNCGWSQS